MYNFAGKNWIKVKRD